ncbi:MAG: hypothetical protein ACOYOT_03900 [Bacteroidales bacterium]
MKLKNLVFALGLISTSVAFAQEAQVDPVEALSQRITLLEDAKTVSSKLKISGYIQAQYQSTQVDSLGKGSQDMKVGAAKQGTETTDYNRFGIRRGRIKLAYEDFGCQAAVQFDLTEKGLALKDAYMNILDPWVGYAAVKGGIFDRPFGYEISYSSSRRESPERSRVFQTLFPDERDLGFMLTLQAPKTSPWNVLKLEAGLFAGNGIAQDNDSKKDFIGHLSYSKPIGNSKVGLGVSMYNGFVAQTNVNVYSVTNGAYVLDATASNKNSFAKRQYLGVDGQVSTSSFLGLTTLRAEYIGGTQPGNSANSGSPKTGNIGGTDNLNTTPGIGGTDTYIRKFQGGYIHFVQDILDTKHSIEVKYDWYDPNTDLSAAQIGVGSKTSKVDVAYSTIGLGYLYRMNSNVRIMAYYDIVSNEKTKLTGYNADLKDNLFTLRFQYKF